MAAENSIFIEELKKAIQNLDLAIGFAQQIKSIEVQFSGLNLKTLVTLSIF